MSETFNFPEDTEKFVAYLLSENQKIGQMLADEDNGLRELLGRDPTQKELMTLMLSHKADYSTLNNISMILHNLKSLRWW